MHPTYALLVTEDITLRWRSEMPLAGVIHLPWPFDFLEPSLKVLNIQPNSIVVPGLTGTNHQLQFEFRALILDP
jgi:hypothetical protein